MKVITVNCGSSNVKATNGEVELLYGNKLVETQIMNTLNQVGAKVWDVEYDSTNYLVGEGAEQEVAVSEGKATEEHIIATLTAVANLRGDAQEVALVYNESLNMFKTSGKIENIRKKFLGKHEINVDKRKHEFTIKEVLVLPEGTGNVLLDSKNMNGRVLVIDIGGSTINVVSLYKLRAELSRSFSVPIGMHNLVANIRDEVHTKLNRNLQEHYIASAMEFRDETPELLGLIDSMCAKRLRELDSIAIKRGLDLNDYKHIYFVGGGVKMLESQIKSHYGTPRAVIVEDPIWADTRGNHKLGVMLYEKQATNAKV